MMLEPDATPDTVRPPRAFLKSARRLLWFAALAGVLLILLHESLFTGKGLVPADGLLTWPPWNRAIHPSNTLLSDQFYTFLPTQEFVHQQKSFPLWNPDLCCGVPNLGAIDGALLFPIRLLFSPLDPFSASAPSAFLKLCLAGWFTMLYVRLLGMSNASSFLAGLVFSLSGFMIAWLGHPQVNSALCLPLLLYFVEKSFRAAQGNAVVAPALRAWAGFAIAFACMILGGHMPTVIHVTIVLVIYFFFRLWEYRRDQALPRIGLLAGAIAVGLLLAAPQILPYLEYYGQSSSAQSSVSMARWLYHLSFASLVRYLLPNAMGNPAVGFEDLPNLLGWHEMRNFNEQTGYVGILPLFFAAYAIAWRRCKFTKLFFFLSIGSMLVIYGVPPIPTLIWALPVLCYMSHMRLLLMVGFSVAVLAALGWDEFFNRIRTHGRTWIVTVGFCAVVGVALLCFCRVIGPQLHILDEVHWAFLRRQFLILAGGMVVIFFLALWPARWTGWIPMAICLVWTAVDLLCFGTGYNPAIPRALYYPPTPAIEWLQKDDSLFRIFGGGAILSPNSAEVFGLSDARGCDFVTVRRYEELITGRVGDFLFYMNPPAIPPAFPLLNVKYFLAAQPFSLDTNLFELAYSKEILIFRFKECRDRALLVYNYQVEPDKAAVLARVSSPKFDPRKVLLLEDQPVPIAIGGPTTRTNMDSSVRITSYEPDGVKIDASLPRPGYLLLLDTYFPGWSATVNGEPAPIHRADYNFRAVSLPAGKSTVCFSYRPASLRIGLYLCAAGVLAVVAAWFLPCKRKSGAPPAF